MPNHAKGLLIVGLGVVAMSPDSLVIRLLRMNAFSIVFWQGLVATIGFTGLATLIHRRETPSLYASMDSWDLLVGAFFAADSILFVVAVTHTTVAATLVIIAASPVFAAVLSTIFLGDPIGRAMWAACAVILLGVAVIVRANLGGGHLVGDLAACAASVSTAATFVVLRRRPHADALPGLTASGPLAALVALAGAGRFAPTAHQLFLLLVLGLVLSPVAFGLVTRGPAYLTAPEISLVRLLETVLGPVWVWIGVGERPSRVSLLCGAVVLAVLAAHSTAALRAETRAPA